RVRVDEAALLLRNEDVAVGAEDVGGDVAAPRAAPMRGKERGSSGALRAGADIERDSAVAADELHDAAHGRGAVEIGGAAAEDLDAVERRARHAAPVDPAAEGIVERDAVVENKRARRPAGADAAQRDALRGRVGRAAAGAAEEGEAGNL